MLKAITLYDQALATRIEDETEDFVLSSSFTLIDAVTNQAKDSILEYLWEELIVTELEDGQTNTITTVQHLMEAKDAGMPDFTLESVSALGDHLSRLNVDELDLLLQWTLNNSMVQLTRVLNRRRHGDTITFNEEGQQL